jgi:hypothetical protein
VRLRLGVSLWILSWIPYGVLLGLHGHWRTLAWILEGLLGVVGLAIAGQEFARAIKRSGWRGAPAVAYRTLLHGTDGGVAG